jgi:phosphoadenosine phosphosulfate reductase
MLARAGRSSVLVQMVSELGRDVEVVALDTHLLFTETYQRRDRLARRYGLSLVSPDVLTVEEQHEREGPKPWESDPDRCRCCGLRKVEPFARALVPYEAWISGLRRDESRSRAGARKLERSERYGVWKLNPLADWSEEDVWRYIGANEISYTPLHDRGYRSIGCVPCTRPTRAGEDERAGRWAGFEKPECGIHGERRGE